MLQFWPKNPSLKMSLQYTGKLKVKFMVQARQLRHAHADAHYCSAQHTYVFGVKSVVNLNVPFAYP